MSQGEQNMKYAQAMGGRCDHQAGICLGLCLGEAAKVPDATLSFTEAMDIHRQDKAARFEVQWQGLNPWHSFDPTAPNAAMPLDLWRARYRLIPKKSRLESRLEELAHGSGYSRNDAAFAAGFGSRIIRDVCAFLRADLDGGQRGIAERVERHFLGGG